MKPQQGSKNTGHQITGGKRLGEKGKMGGINGGILGHETLLQTKPQPSTTRPQESHMLMVQGQRK